MYDYEEICKNCVNTSETMCITCDGGYHKQTEGKEGEDDGKS